MEEEYVNEEYNGEESDMDSVSDNYYRPDYLEIFTV